ncbi:MAG: BspA family leucine-rich repeat surface protein [Eubacterium sp.]|nr:BspA family leucine-rich repeat surface protein [Eubacterium sp.]
MKTNMITRYMSRARKNSIRNEKKGFTMVELLVVLVIIAVLAAVAIPALLGFTDSAKEKQYIAEGKEALTAAQTMMNDVYTNNLLYVPKKMREEALKTSGLSDNTEFIIYTVKQFNMYADGTSDSIGCYTIAEALYRAEDGSYYYYDGTNWEKVEQEDTLVVNAKRDNYICVWPSDDYKSDTAGTKRYTVITGEDGEETVVSFDIDETTASNDTPETGFENSTEEESTVDYGSSYNMTVIFEAAPAVTGSITGQERTAMSFRNGTTPTSLTTSYNETDELVDEPDVTINTTFFENDYEWSWGGGQGSLDEVKNYLSGIVAEQNGGEIRIIGRVKQKTVEVPVSFFAYNPDTLKVEVDVDGAIDSDVDKDRLKDTITVDYGLADETLISDNVEIDGNAEDALNIESLATEENEDAVTYDKWVMKEGTDYRSDSEGEGGYAWISGSDIWNEVVSWAANEIDSSRNIDAASANITANGVRFELPADINKTLYVRGILKDDNSYEGIVTFGSDAENAVFMFNKEYTRNELIGEIYPVDAESPVNFDANLGETYSVFDDNDILVNGEPIAQSVKKLKFWHIYESDKDYTVSDDLSGKEDPDCRNRIRDCSEIMLDKLYNEDYSGYGEVAEIDVADLTTKLMVASSNTSDTPLAGNKFNYLANGNASNIASVHFLTGTERPGYDDLFRERCLSTTSITESGTRLKKDSHGKYVISYVDDDYPSYTVAYSVKNSEDTSRYDIYVFTEDGSDMKAEGSLQKLHNGAKNMKSNNFVSHLETSDVTNMSYMFGTCAALESVDISNFDTSSVTNMSFMFDMGNAVDACGDITSIDFSGISGESLTNASHMFRNCKNLETLRTNQYVSFPAITAMDYMFESCEALPFDNMTFAVPSNPAGVNCEGMYLRCSGLTKVSLNITYAIKISRMFEGCTDLEKVTLCGNNADSSADNAVVTNLTNGTYNIFLNCASVEDITIRGLKLNFVSNVGFTGFFPNSVKETLCSVTIDNVSLPTTTTLASLFGSDNEEYAAKNLTSVSITNSDFSAVTTMNQMFRNCTGITSTGISFDGTSFSACTNTSWMFAGCTGLTGELDFDLFDTTTVNDFNNMFNGCSGLTSVKDFHIDRSSNISSMFLGCSELTAVTLTGSNSDNDDENAATSTITGAGNIFNNCSKLTSVTLKNLKFSSLTSNGMNGFFSHIRPSVKNVVIDNIYAPGVTSFNQTFGSDTSTSAATSLESVSITDSNFPKVDTMYSMFRNCSSLNSVVFTGSDISTSEDVTVVNMKNMFRACIAFGGTSGNVSLDNLNTDKANDMSYMFDGCTALQWPKVSGITPKYPAGTNCAYMFRGCTAFIDTVTFDITYVNTFNNIFENCTGLTGITLKGSGKDGTACILNNSVTCDDAFKNAGAIVDENKVLNITIKDMNLSNVSSASNATSTSTGNGFYKLCQPIKKAATSVSFEHISIQSLYSVDQSLMGSNDNLSSISFTDFDVPNLQRMKQFMMGSKGLTTVTFSGLNASPWNWNSVFEGCSRLTSIDFGNVGEEGEIKTNTGNPDSSTGMTDFNSLFRGCFSLTTIIGLDKFDTSNAKDMQYMFDSCYSLRELDLTNFNTEKIVREDKKGFYYMFGTQSGDTVNGKTASDLTTIYASEDFVINKDNQIMFGDKLTNLVGGNGTKFVDIKASDKSYYNKTKYGWIDGRVVSGRDSSQGYFTKTTYAKFKRMGDNWVNSFGFGKDITVLTGFQRCTDKAVYESYKSGAIEISDASYTDPDSGVRIPIYAWIDSDNVFNWYSEATKVYIHENTVQMFNYVRNNTGQSNNLKWVDFQGVDISLVKSFDHFFSSAKLLEGIYDRSVGEYSDYRFINSLSENMCSMFDSCNLLESVDLSGLSTKNVTTMDHMFMDCASLKTVDLSCFSSENLTKCDYMFRMRENKTFTKNGNTLNVGNDNILEKVIFGADFNCSMVTDMQYMFSNCNKLKSLDLSMFDASKNDEQTLNVSNMFNGCSNLKTILVSDPAETDGRSFYSTYTPFTSRINSSGSMFNKCTSLVGGDESTLSTSGGKTDATYARIGNATRKGYFTKKEQ